MSFLATFCGFVVYFRRMQENQNVNEVQQNNSYCQKNKGVFLPNG